MASTPANWYPDPLGRYELRYWDGEQWTSHVSRAGQQHDDPLDGSQPVQVNTSADKIREQVSDTSWRGAGIDASTVAGGGTLFSEPVLVVNQKAKLIEVTNQYAVFDRNGTQIGSVSEVGQSAAKKVLRVVSSLDQFMTHRLEVRGADGELIMSLTRPRKVFKSTVIVTDPAGNEIGRIVQENMIGKIHFALQAGGQTLGAIKAENWRAWNFRIEDHAANEIARITKTFEGFAKTLFTTADNYVVQLHARIPQPLLSLVVASALCVDTALKQDSRGLG